MGTRALAAAAFLVAFAAGYDDKYFQSPVLRDWVALQEALEAAEQSAAAAPAAPVDLPGQPPRPWVPSRFVAPFEQKGHAGWGSEHGLFAQDVDKKAMRMDTSRPFNLAPKLDPPLLTNSTQLMLGQQSYQIDGVKDKVCRAFPSTFGGFGGFHDLFGWAANPLLSAFAGYRSVQGRSCALWRFRLGLGGRLNQTLCADGNSPVELNVSFGHVSASSFRFGRIEAEGSEVDPTLLEKPALCDSLAPACFEGRGVEPVTIDAYVFHPGMSPEDYDLADQDVADLKGDAVFICADRMQNKTSFIDHNYTRISRYLLQVSPAFGQYAACNGYPDTSPPGPFCFGGDTRLVGREAPLFAGDGELRCAAESPVGFWYNLPKAGRCAPGSAPGRDAWRGGCTWAVQRRVKTVDQACLLEEHPFVKHCFQDLQEGKGFPRSEAALMAAFGTEDPSKGGCPDIGGPGGEQHESVGEESALVI